MNMATITQARDVRPSTSIAARRAVTRWAWRLFKREWRQHLLVLGLIVVAVAATVLGATVAGNSPPPLAATFGSAQDIATYTDSPSHLADEIAKLHERFGKVEAIEATTLALPGSTRTYQLRQQDPHGPFSGPLLQLIAGRYPSGAGEVAMTKSVASALGLQIGSNWLGLGNPRRVVGFVRNPDSLLQEFVLIPPGQLPNPTEATVFFDAGGIPPFEIGPTAQSRSFSRPSAALNAETISIAAITIGMLLIALVSIGAFTVLAQKRLRSLGMLAAVGATPKQVGMTVRMNGLAVGVVGSLLGSALGIALWLAYRPALENSSHHLIGAFALPWAVLAAAVALGIVATYFGASRPARAMVKTPVVAALSGRPAPPQALHRSAIPGVALLVAAFLLLGYAAAGAGAQPRPPALVAGLITLVVGVVLLAPFSLALLAALGRRAPIAVRLALRDLNRYRSRSGSALSAISVSILIAAMVVVAGSIRYSSVVDYVGPNLASNQLLIQLPYTPGPQVATAKPGSVTKQAGPGTPQSPTAAMTRAVEKIASMVGGAKQLQLVQANLFLRHAAAGRQWSGAVYVATPQLLRFFGIENSSISPKALILSMRPGLSSLGKMQLMHGGGYFPGGSSGGGFPCPAYDCLANPQIQEISSLPSGTSAPNTVATEYAMKTLHLSSEFSGWLLQAAKPISAYQLNQVRVAAAAAGLQVESKNEEPSSAQVINWATAFGIALALAILAMSVSLVRSEAANDLRTLSATGAGRHTLRALAASSAAALALAGAVLGTAAAYISVAGVLRTNVLNGGLASLGNVPVPNLVAILVGMPLLAGLAGWVLGGKEPPALARRAIE